MSKSKFEVRVDAAIKANPGRTKYQWVQSAVASWYDLAKERKRKKWWIEHRAMHDTQYDEVRWLENGNLRTIKIINGDINAAIDEAMK